MPLTNSSIDKSLDPTIDRLLFILSVITFVLLCPYFIWGNLILVLRISHLLGNLIILYIIIKHHNFDIYHIGLVLFFALVAIYTMVGGTEIHKFNYVPLLTLLFISLKPNEQLRVFNYFVTILAVVYSIGLVSYSLSILGLNVQIGTAIAPDLAKSPFYVFLGHAKESGLPIYRFSSVFDEAGVVGTLNGLIISAIGVSTRNIKSIIILLAGLISFSLAFYIMLILFLLFNLNFKKVILGVIVIISLIFFSGDKFNDLIASRLAIENGRLVGDNRTSMVFDEWYNYFLTKGGKDLIFGRGSGSFLTIEEAESVSTYKTSIINYGIIGVGLILCFYALCVYFNNNSMRGWFLCFIFFISAYQRPDILNFYIIVMLFGGLRYLKLNFTNT